MRPLLAVALLLAAPLTTAAVPGARPARPAGTPRPSAPALRADGMTLAIRSGRLVVTEVAKGSPAERAGLLPLDVILVVDGRSLADLDPISPQQAIDLFRTGTTDPIRLIVGRGAGTLTLSLPRDRGRPAPGESPPDLHPGVQAPVFSGRDIDGRVFALKELRGRTVLIDFWLSTCPPCEQAVIPIRRLADEYAGRLEIVGVSLDEDRKAFEAFVYNRHLPGTQLFDGAGWRGSIPRSYGVALQGVPHYVLVDVTGRIAALGTLDDVEPAIGSLLHKAP